MRKEVRDRPANHRCLRVEHLEDRRLLAVLTVQNDLDDTLANLAGDGQLSLREAIEIANNPGTAIDGFVSNDVDDTIEFARPFFDESRTIALADGELEITETLTIDGPGRDSLTIDAGGGFNGIVGDGDGYRIFKIEDGNSDAHSDVLLRGLTLTGGDISDDTLLFPDSETSGGAIFSVENLTVLDSTVVANAAQQHGGAIYIDHATLTIKNSDIMDNQARFQVFRLGTRFGDGGGVFANNAIVDIIGTSIEGNSARGRGGGIVSSTGVSITGSTVSGNTSSGEGGGLFALGGHVNVNSSTISGNTSYSSGGGICVGLGSLSLHSSTVSHNKTLNSRSRGGGVFVDSGAVNVLFSTITGNRTIGRDSDGGGIYARTGPLEIVGSTISGNSTEDELSRGGGILSLHGEISVYQSTISDNAARESEGGGIFTGNFSAISIVTIQNSIISRNTDRGVSPDLPNLSGANILDFSNNLLGSTTGNNFDANTGVGNLLNVDPLLGPLADNGGPTQTHALLPGSPALDAGDPSIIFDPNEFDQRGAPFSRVATGILSGIPGQRIDIGAYEAQSPPSADFVGDDHVNGQDFLAWQIGFGMTENATRADGDSDGDGDVDHSDLAAWRVSYGQTEMPPPPVAALSAVSEERSARLADAVLGVEFGNVLEDYEAILTEWSFMDDGELVRNLEPNIVDAPHSEAAESQQVQADSTVRKENERLVDELLKTVFE